MSWSALARAVVQKIVVLLSHVRRDGPFYDESRDARQEARQEERDKQRTLAALESLGANVPLSLVA